MDFYEFVKPELLVLVPALYGLGAILKNTKKIKDNFIPAILSGVGIVLACLHVLGTEGVTAVGVFTAIIQGIICAACAVYTNQLIKQAKNGE